MILAVDFGRKRCGYAYGEISPRNFGVTSQGGIKKLLIDINPSTVVMGLPLSMSGRYSCQTFEVIKFAEGIKSMGFMVRLVDERLSTKIAHEILKRSGSSTPVDAISASLIFESFVRNPNSSYSIPDEIPRIDLDPLSADRILIHNIPDASVLDKIDATELDVLQKDPYIAYLFKKKVRFVERFEEFLKGDYDIIITESPERVENLLSPRGKIVCP